MPIDTSSDGWRDSKKSTVKEDVISFLESNRGQAYSVRELSDEVLSTNWEARHEEDRDGSDAPEVDDGLADLQADQRATTSLVAVLDQLVDEGKLNVE